MPITLNKWKEFNSLMMNDFFQKGNIDEVFAYNLKLPCRNRWIKLVIDKQTNITMDGKRFYTQGQCVRYIESKPRVDFTKG